MKQCSRPLAGPGTTSHQRSASRPPVGQAQLQVAAQVMPIAEDGERRQVFDMPDLATMPTAATNDWMSAAYPGFDLTLPEV
jgi:hypothetical protein